MDSMTAKMCAFARAYPDGISNHYLTEITVFDGS